ncbi:hypothetical protein PR002_g23281 [Phytophthora rubi]|uniref:Uncharacterized protein n=1 Tax=Phytophthora rubi TaxID=129364 RepID=A0A6A3IV48_9STRA|nr:hypothetical protein PR002_g23281 [Phytophthora rubi]
MAGTSAFPFWATVTVVASITEPNLCVGTKIPRSPSSASTATSMAVTVLCPNRFVCAIRTAATRAPLAPSNVRNGITTVLPDSSYRNSFIWKSIVAR